MKNDRKYKWELLPNSTADLQESYWLLDDDPVSIRLLEDFLKSSSIMSEFQYGHIMVWVTMTWLTENGARWLTRKSLYGRWRASVTMETA